MKPAGPAVLLAVLTGVVAGCGGGHSGPRLAYAVASDARGSRYEIFTADPDGSRPVALAEGRLPAISPDGRWVAFVRQQAAEAELWLVRARGGSPRLLRTVRGGEAPMSQPVWAPDSFRLAVVAGGSLVVLDRGAGPQLTAATDVMQVSSVDDPSFDPQSHRLVYERVDHSGSDLYAIDLTSGDTTPLTHDHASASPVWGVSGIAFAQGKDVWLMQGDGTGARRLTHTDAGIVPAAWSADGRRLLAASPAMHNGRLWAVSVPSGKARPLTGWVGDLFPQGLSRSGETALAAVGCGGRQTPFGVLETIPFTGGRPSVLVRGPCRATWSR